jgi:septum site-determining protein MinD
MTIPSGAPDQVEDTVPGVGAGRLIVVFGTKGGVGKTMVAANLAVGLAQQPSTRACLVDLDLMAVGDLARTLSLSIPRGGAERAAAAKPAADEPFPLDGLAVRHPAGVDVVAGLSNPRQSKPLDPALLPKLFQALKARYDYIVVDGGKAFSEPLMLALNAANLILLVATPDHIALYQTKWALSVVEDLAHSPPKAVKAILNRAESLGSLDTPDAVAALPCEVIGELPSDGKTVGTAVNRGVPVITAFPQTKVAEALLAVVSKLAGHPELYTEAETPRPAPARPAANGSLTPAWLSRLYREDQRAEMEAAVDEIVRMKRRIHDRLIDALDLKKLDLTVMAGNTSLLELRQKTEQVIRSLLSREASPLIASPEVSARLVKEITDEALGLGPLEDLLADPGVTDILVNGKDQIFVERHGRLSLTTKKFMSDEQVRTVIERIVAPINRRIDEASPMVDARLPDGSRVHAVIPPASVKGPVLSIRKFARARFSEDDLIRGGTLTPEMAAFLRACVLARKSIVISGGAGAGKTTLLNAISAFIPDRERIITIEDAAELQLSQTHWVSLESRLPNMEGRGQITIRELLRNALRMRPDRIIIGECRGGEAFDMLQAMNTGHDGSLTTIHANSPRDVFSRLQAMVLMSGMELPLRAIEEMIAAAVHLIVHTARCSDGTRRVVAIAEVVRSEHEPIVSCRELFAFRQDGVSPEGAVRGAFAATGAPSFLEEFKAKGIGWER